MGADSVHRAVAAAGYVGVDLSTEQCVLLTRYHRWLVEEGVRAGGIGPGESDRLWDRHIADSIVFGLALHNAIDCLDIGSGAGLPGIPLAIVFPATHFKLLDRAGRRCDLLRRAIAVLEIDNCSVEQQEVAKVAERYSRIVSRAAIPLESMMIHVKQLLEISGIAVIGVTRRAKAAPPETPELSGLQVDVVRVPGNILDSGAYLLRIGAT